MASWPRAWGAAAVMAASVSRPALLGGRTRSALAVGGSGGSGGAGNVVSVTNGSNITTQGNNSDGLLAQSIGGGGGSGGCTVSARGVYGSMWR